uniref:Sesquiterpene synthase 1-2 n=1 Tax=Tripterygium wilfordii TaxID=458696 RepID=A0A7S5GI44_TRIWF|nr:sesquiterpene synthase 1-2 [Tripterygium wilfordii]
MAAQQLLQCKLKSRASDPFQQRRSANYKPNIWSHEFLQSLSNNYDEEQYRSQFGELKEHVKRLFIDADDLLSKLELIDSIKKLGLANHFREEIKEALDNIASKNQSTEADLYSTALRFKVLRQNGYEVFQDVFSVFVDEEGTFGGKISCDDDTKGIIELFEASHLALEADNILDEAKAFSTRILETRSSRTESSINKQVIHALELPCHWRVQWFDVKWYIEGHDHQKEKDSLLELAKLNFNVVQNTLQKDLRELSGWWKNLGLIENLSFARNRLVECFMCTAAFAYEPHHNNLRKWLTKVLIMIAIIDDVYDVYGSLEELHHFTIAVDRWNSSKIQQLPECMKLCFQALTGITNEVAREMQTENNWSHQVLPHLKKVWADFCKALFVEAKWHKTGHMPSLKEYMNNAWITSSGSLISVHLLFSTLHEDTKEILETNEDLVYNLSLVIRLCNDLGTSAAELQRGDAPSSILCYRRENNVPEAIAREHIKGLINETMKKMNAECFGQSALELQPFTNIIMNVARMVHNLYLHGDGFGVQDGETRRQIASVLVEPFSLV